MDGGVPEHVSKSQVDPIDDRASNERSITIAFRQLDVHVDRDAIDAVADTETGDAAEPIAGISAIHSRLLDPGVGKAPVSRSNRGPMARRV